MSGASAVSLGGSTPRAATRELSRVFAEHHALVWRFLRRFGLSEEAAADATEHVFRAAAGELSRVTRAEQRATLLASALCVLDIVRWREVRWQEVRAQEVRGHAVRGQAVRGQEEQDPVQHVRAEPGCSGVVRASPLRPTSAPGALMARALVRMTRLSAAIFVLFEIEGLPLGEAAAVLGLDGHDAERALSQARAEFRAIVNALVSAARR